MQTCKTFCVHKYCTLIVLIFKYKLWSRCFSAGFWSYAVCYFILKNIYLCQIGRWLSGPPNSFKSQRGEVTMYNSNNGDLEPMDP